MNEWSLDMEYNKDWSLIIGRGATKLENKGFEIPPPPPPQDREKPSAPALLKSANFSRPPFSVAKRLYAPLFVGVKFYLLPPLPPVL